MSKALIEYVTPRIIASTLSSSGLCTVRIEGDSDIQTQVFLEAHPDQHAAMEAEGWFTLSQMTLDRQHRYRRWDNDLKLQDYPGLLRMRCVAPIGILPKSDMIMMDNADAWIGLGFYDRSGILAGANP